MKLKTHPAVENELGAAVAWYDARSSTAGDRFLEEFSQSIERITSLPLAWQKLSHNVRRCSLSHFPYGVVYHVKKDEIIILAVMHLHRKPGYWKERLK